ncbi:MAG: hypothetical protein AAFX87_26975 [Bacteroidota bacterium]
MEYLATTYYVIGIDIVVALVTLWLLKAGKASNTVIAMTGLFSALWIGFLHWVFSTKSIFPPDMSGFSFYLIILGAVLVSGVLLYMSPPRKTFFNLSQEQIQMVQGLRVFVGAGFLMEGSLRVIPSGFGILDGYLHITSAFPALMAAICYAKAYSFKKDVLWLANIVGILDPIIIVTGICFFVWGDMGPHHNMMYVVFYAAPIILWLHFVSVSKLIKEQSTEKVGASKIATV